MSFVMTHRGHNILRERNRFVIVHDDGDKVVRIGGHWVPWYGMDYNRHNEYYYYSDYTRRLYWECAMCKGWMDEGNHVMWKLRGPSLSHGLHIS